MERITKRSFDTTKENGVCCTHFLGPACLSTEGNCADGCIWEEAAWERLAHYEDTRLTPAEVHSMYGEWNAMMSVLNSIGSYDRLRELAEADKDGRVVVLPCNVGDTVYTTFGHKVEERRVIEFDVVACKSSGCVVHASLAAERQVTMSVRWDLVYGKMVFLTREEAEAALKGVKNGRG